MTQIEIDQLDDFMARCGWPELGGFPQMIMEFVNTHLKKSANEQDLQEPASENLEKAAGEYAYYEREDDVKGEGGYDLSKLEGFIEGANWQKRQMMKDSLDACIAINTYPKTWMPELVVNSSDDMKALVERMGLEHEDKVKLVIVKDK